jgi:hypothetical protein
MGSRSNRPVTASQPDPAEPVLPKPAMAVVELLSEQLERERERADQAEAELAEARQCVAALREKAEALRISVERLEAENEWLRAGGRAFAA